MNICEAIGCKDSKFRKQWCSRHYQKYLRYGNADVVYVIRGENRKKHPLYKTYSAMRLRCTSKKDKDYPYYGARGITVCDRWLGPTGFSNFIADMPPKPTPQHTLDRIDNYLGYSPENCRWATQFTQQTNRRNNNTVPGVAYNKRIGQWGAYITVAHQRIHLGYYQEHSIAAVARWKAEMLIGL